MTRKPTTASTMTAPMTIGTIGAFFFGAPSTMPNDGVAMAGAEAGAAIGAAVAAAGAAGMAGRGATGLSTNGSADSAGSGSGSITVAIS